LRTQSATSTITHTVTVAAGVYAPGHLGERTQYLPFELVDDVLEATRTVQRRLRDLPSRVGVYFVLALVLYARLGYVRVWGKLTAGLAGIAVAHPSEKALRDLRRRLGAGAVEGPVRGGGQAAGPAAHPGGSLRWAAHGGFRRVELAEVPDSDRNRGWLGRICYRLGFAGYPKLRLMTLVETGTRGLLGAALGSLWLSAGVPATEVAQRLGHSVAVLLKV
jgi:hypothetical protein